jgi:hypothetical protein
MIKVRHQVYLVDEFFIYCCFSHCKEHQDCEKFLECDNSKSNRTKLLSYVIGLLDVKSVDIHETKLHR